MQVLEFSEADVVDVHRFVARRVANPADAADIAQQALLQAWASLDTCRGDSLWAWLSAIARHLIVDHFRAHGRVRFVEVTELAETEPALRTPPDTTLAGCELREHLRCWTNCIGRRLRLEEQVAVLLADIYGHRDKESAAVLRMSVPCFKLLLHRARTHLHEAAGRDCMLVRKTCGACDAPVNGHNGKKAASGNGGPPAASPTHRLGVTCRVSAPELLALRSRLLEGLRP